MTLSGWHRVRPACAPTGRCLGQVLTQRPVGVLAGMNVAKTAPSVSTRNNPCSGSCHRGAEGRVSVTGMATGRALETRTHGSSRPRPERGGARREGAISSTPLVPTPRTPTCRISLGGCLPKPRPRGAPDSASLPGRWPRSMGQGLASRYAARPDRIGRSSIDPHASNQYESGDWCLRGRAEHPLSCSIPCAGDFADAPRLWDECRASRRWSLLRHLFAQRTGPSVRLQLLSDSARRRLLALGYRPLDERRRSRAEDEPGGSVVPAQRQARTGTVRGHQPPSPRPHRPSRLVPAGNIADWQGRLGSADEPQAAKQRESRPVRELDQRRWKG